VSRKTTKVKQEEEESREIIMDSQSTIDKSMVGTKPIRTPGRSSP
jgi:hypothetical protein